MRGRNRAERTHTSSFGVRGRNRARQPVLRPTQNARLCVVVTLPRQLASGAVAQPRIDASKAICDVNVVAPVCHASDEVCSLVEPALCKDS